MTETADVYSLGAILYCLLVGRPPFQAASPMDTLLQVLDTEPVPPRQINQAIPRDLETTCLKCLEKDPARRYSSAQQLADELARHLAGEPIHARPVGPASRLWKWCRRKPLIAGLTAATSLAILLGMVASIAGAIVSANYALEAQTRAQGEKRQAKLATQAATEAQRQEQIARKAQTRAEKNASELDDANRQLQSALEEAEEQTKRAETRFYASQIAAARAAWDSGDVALAQTYLDRCPPHVRGWEYDHLVQLIYRSQETIATGQFEVSSVCFDHKGKRLVTGAPSQLELWDVASGNLLTSYPSTGNLLPHIERIAALAISPDDQLLASASSLRVKLWDLSRGVLLREFKGHERRIGDYLLFSSDGKMLLSAPATRAHSAVVWDVATGEVLFSPRLSGMCNLAFSLDGTQLACISDGSTKEYKITIYDTASGKERSVLSGHDNYVKCLAFTADGKKLVSGSVDKTIRLWDVVDGSHRVVSENVGSNVEFQHLQAGPAGKRVLVRLYERLTNQRKAVLYDSESGSRLAEWPAPTGLSHASAAFSPNGDLLAVVDDNVVRLRNAATGELHSVVKGHADSIVCLQFDAAGKMLVSADSSGNVIVSRIGVEPHRAFLKDSEHRYDSRTRTFAVANEQHALVRTGGRWAQFDLRSGRALEEIDWLNSNGTSVTFTDKSRLAISHDGSHIVVPGLRVEQNPDDIVRIANQSGELDKLLNLGGPCHLSPGGNLALVSRTIYDTKTGDKIADLTGDTVGRREYSPYVAFDHPANRIATCRTNGPTRIYDARNGQQLNAFKGPLTGQGSSRLTFSKDGRWLAEASRKSVVLRDLQSSESGVVLEGHTDAVRCLAFSSGGDRLFSGGDDHAIFIWDTATGVETAKLTAHQAPVTSLAVSASGVLISVDPTSMTIAHYAEPLPRFHHVYLADQGVSNPSGAVVFSATPDGRRLVTCDFTGRIVVRDGVTKRIVQQWLAHENRVRFFAVGPRGGRAMTAAPAEDGSQVLKIKMWDTQTGGLLWSISQPHDQGDFRMVGAWMPDGKSVLVSMKESSVRRLSTETGRQIRAYETNDELVTSVKASHDGSRIVTTGSDGVTRIWDASTGAVLHEWKDDARTAVFSHDGSWLACTRYPNYPDTRQSEVCIRDLTTGEVMHTFDIAGSLGSLTAHPTESKLLVGGGGLAMLDVDRGDVLFEWRGRRITELSRDGERRTRAVGRSDELSSVRGASFTAGGKQIIWSDGRTIVVMNSDVDKASFQRNLPVSGQPPLQE